MKNFVLLPAALAFGLSACASNGVQPGIVNGSSGSGGYQTASAPVSSMGTGRVVSINEVALAGAGGGSGSGNGPLSGGLIGGAGGAAIGGIVSHGGIGGLLIGGLLGAVGGAIAGSIYDGHHGSGRGIEVTVQREDGATMKVAQRDEGDIQLGDRVQVVEDGHGVKKVVRDNSRAPDNAPPYAQNNGPQYGGPQYNGPQDNGPQNNGPQYNGPQDNGPPPQDMQSSSQRYVPRGQDNNPPPQNDQSLPRNDQSYSQSRYTPSSPGGPRNDPRYGSLD
jgi:outer membrane lipoprotein SlyB